MCNLELLGIHLVDVIAHVGLQLGLCATCVVHLHELSVARAHTTLCQTSVVNGWANLVAFWAACVIREETSFCERHNLDICDRSFFPV